MLVEENRSLKNQLKEKLDSYKRMEIELNELKDEHDTSYVATSIFMLFLFPYL